MRIATSQAGHEVDDDLLERRMDDWKRSEAAARDAERKAAANRETGDVRPLAQRAAQLRRIADLILASILEDMQIKSRCVPSPAEFGQL